MAVFIVKQAKKSLRRKVRMSPFRSKAQMAYLYANHPDIAKRWSKEFPNQNTKKLPKHVKKSKGKRK